MVTRDDVARRAGVSTAVVSYVVNDGPRAVAPETARRVRAAMTELGYRPNGVARALALNRTQTIAFVVPDQSNSFFAALGQHVETAAFEHDYIVLLGNTMEDPDREVRYVEVFRQRAVDGFIIGPTATPSPALAVLAASDRPVVLIDRDGERDDLSRVLADNAGGGHAATRHLVEHGHERIACLTGPPGMSNAVLRQQGWRRAMRGAGLSTTGLTIRSNFTRADAYAATALLLAHDERPTAIFAAADEQALGVYRAARDAGLRIPDDLALVSFDSGDLAPYLAPTLTAVQQPARQMATVAVARLLEQISLPAITADVLPVELVVRESCGCHR